MKMKNNIEHDLSTINREELEKLSTYLSHSFPSYHLQSDPGNGCFLDPPGFPSYFTRSIYNSSGNEPIAGATKVLLGKVVESRSDWNNVANWDEVCNKRSSLLRRLWKPLPLDHPRTVAWIKEVYKHLQHCYHDKDASESDKTLIYPLPSHKLRSFVDDKRFSEEWRIKERAAVDQANADIIANALKIAVPENHMAVRSIQKFYPEHVPDLELIRNPPKTTPNWWERFSECPLPEDCPGQYGTLHPVNGSWCQMCGWRDPKTK